MSLPQYHKDLSSLHVNTLKPRAYFIPHDCLEDALSGDRNNSYYLTNLCGDWNFKYFDTFEDVTDGFVDGSFNFADLPEVKVPGCFQLYKIGEYDKPLYSNLKYPHMTDPPHVPTENPCGIYYKNIEISSEMLERENILTFEGVSSCFYLWINGKFVGYSQVSHCTSEFAVNEYLKEGTNTFAVLVVKWCDGSYLEDQDFIRLSGIFREVYLLSRNKVRIEDVQIKQSFTENYGKAILTVDASLTENAPVLYGVAAPGGDLIKQGESNTSNFTIEIENPHLWNDETPYVYTLFLTVEDEIIPFQLALRDIEIKDKKLLINGLPVRIKGINRHDSSAENGYAVTLDEMKRDLLLMKAANCNAIRTSHYPNDPRFYDLAEALGFYFIDEADIETHGMGFNTDADWDWFRWSMLSTVDEWEEAYVDRAMRLYERDKNHGSVIMWSLGNESGCGKNHRAMGKYIKSRDEKAIIHYENAHLEFKAVPEGECFADISDVESRMYAGTTYLENYVNNPEYTKPFYLCEYVCSMSTGDVYDYWKLADKYESFCGGCIWEWCDHAVNVPDEKGNARYYYGGDFGDFPNDNICCVDGLVFPDRTPRPGYFDMKKVYEPFRGSFCDGVLTLKSVRYFRDLSDYGAKWVLSENSKTVAEGKIETLDVAPQSEKEFVLFDKDKYTYGKNTFLTVSVLQKNDTPWEKAGYEVGFLQFELSKETEESAKESFDITFENGNRYVTVKSGDNEYVFDKPFGRFASIKNNGNELLESPTEFAVWHAPTYNRGSVDAWRANHLDHLMQNTYETEVKEENGELLITTKIGLGGPSSPPAIHATVTYTFTKDGGFTLHANGNIRENMCRLPRFGWKLNLKKENEQIRYFGLGETETYPDRFNAARYGMYETTVTDNFVHYVRPQENANHYKTRFAEVGCKNKAALAIVPDGIKDFCFHALHFSAEQLTDVKHDFELTPEKKTVVNLDWRFNAISENNEQANDENKRLLNEKEFDFGFKITPKKYN